MEKKNWGKVTSKKKTREYTDYFSTSNIFFQKKYFIIK